MKVFIVLSLIASAIAFPGIQTRKSLGIAFPEELDLPHDRIISGWSAENGQFPHQAFLIISDNSGSAVACGGSLISTTWVLTAAHCVYQRVSAQVHLGDVAYSSSPVKITSRDLHYHGAYNPTYLNNDLGLIGLGQAVSLTTNIQVIKIASDTNDLHVGRVAIVSGFGKTSDSGSVSLTLNYVNLTIITNAVCTETYGSSVITSATICGVGVSSGAQGSCNGDSGGPLILRESSGDTLIGIVSFVSSAGCAASYPSGFVRPDNFQLWIDGITGN